MNKATRKLLDLEEAAELIEELIDEDASAEDFDVAIDLYYEIEDGSAVKK